MVEPPDRDGAIAELRAELEQRVRDAEVLAEQLDALQREIESLRQRIADQLE
jgi:prefoldin subunit 5